MCILDNHNININNEYGDSGIAASFRNKLRYFPNEETKSFVYTQKEGVKLCVRIVCHSTTKNVNTLYEMGTHNKNASHR